MAILNKWKGLNRNPRFVFDLLPVDFRFEANGDREAADKRLKNSIASKNRTIQTSLNEIGVKLKLDFGLSMHVARHAFAIWALNERDISLHLVSRMLGHKSIEALNCRNETLQLFRYWFGVIPVCFLKYLKKNEGLAKFSSSEISLMHKSLCFSICFASRMTY